MDREGWWADRRGTQSKRIKLLIRVLLIDLLRQPSAEDELWWMTTMGGRQPSVEDDLWWKTTFGGRRPSVEDDLWGKTTFSGRHGR